MKIKLTVTITPNVELEELIGDPSTPDGRYSLEREIDKAIEGARVTDWNAEYVCHDAGAVQSHEVQKFEADPNYIEQVYLALEQVNPNDAATEVWDDGAIGELANYLKANDYDASDLLADGLQLYAKYDLIKWTRYNF